MAILGSGSFDVADVDTSTIQFEGAAPNKRCSVENVNLDGFDDLVCHFKKQDVSWPQDANCRQVSLTGGQFDGTLFSGSDAACKPGEVNCNNELCPLIPI